ncbi:hypothetical protein NMG60_11008602 [Bertholletia excelsa]
MASGATNDDRPPKLAPPAEVNYPSLPPPYSQHFPPYPPPLYQTFFPPPPPPPPFPLLVAYPHSFPNPHNPYPFPTPPPPPHPLYPQQYLPTSQPRRGFNLICFILTLMIVLIIGAFAMNCIFLFIFGTGNFDFYVKSLRVPYFNATDNDLKARWDANITVKNNNSKLDVQFDRLIGLVIYHEEIILAVAEVQTFELHPHEEATFNVKLSSLGREQVQYDPHNYHYMQEDRKKKEVIFEFRLEVETTLKAHSSFTKSTSYGFLCENVNVIFDGPSGLGTLANDKNHQQRRFILIDN